MSVEALAGVSVEFYIGKLPADFATLQDQNPELCTRCSAAGIGAMILANRVT